MILVACIDDNNCLGDGDNLLYILNQDKLFFKNITLNEKVIMGRKTYESIPEIHGEKLPGRKKIVLTSNKAIQYKHNHDNTYEIIDKITDDFIKNHINDYVIGGSQIYKTFAPYVTEMYLTHVHTTTDCKRPVFFLGYDLNNFSQKNICNFTTADDIKCEIVHYIKNN